MDAAVQGRSLGTGTQRPQSSSASRFTAGASGFLNFNQSGGRPERYVEPKRLETMPSSPILQACANTMSPGCVRWGVELHPRLALGELARALWGGTASREN